MSSSVFLGVVIVTHNHEDVINATLSSLASQTDPADRVVVVDSGSRETAWLNSWQKRPGFDIVKIRSNVGFAAANNHGRRLINPREGLCLFLNPDVVMPPDLFSRLRALSREPRSEGFGAFSPRLLQWDFANDTSTGAIDSTGIFPHWTGTWRDRRAASPAAEDVMEEVPALCGAFFMARIAALNAVALREGKIWDERYFAYKEDVELSLRLRRAGFKLGIWHGSHAGHGRGWRSRKAMPRELRVMSARNECRLHRQYARRRLPLSLMKWAYVRWLER